MNIPFFKAIFIVLFLASFSFGLKAQEDKAPEKWETALVTYGKGVKVIYSDAPTEETPFSQAASNYEAGYQDFLKKVTAMMNDGWSVVSITSTTGPYSEKYFLKRKIK